MHLPETKIDQVASFCNFIHFNLQTLCTLELFNTTRENVIIAGKLSDEIDYSMLSPMESLTKEKVNTFINFKGCKILYTIVCIK